MMELPPPKPGELLATIDIPEDLRKLKPDQLPQVCQEIRDYIVDVVSVHGGHFGASLGAVELTVAMHYVYNTPEDLIVWDVGHQAYGHKILTGRRDRFITNRKLDGLSGFPKRGESEYDTFGVGHSSTSISAALGMALARDILKEQKHVVALIGDGAMTAGLAFEGMNNTGISKSNITVILNDNNMSIDPNVGALNEYLLEMTTSQTFNKIRDEIYDMLGHFKTAGEKMRKVAARMEKALHAVLSPGSLFRAMGFKYYGPIDGHNVKLLVKTLNDLKNIPGPKLLHVVTVKGKGFAPAEKDQVKWHAQGSPFDKLTGESLVKKSDGKTIPKYQDVFGETIVELANNDERIIGITAAMPSGTGLLKMMEQISDRAFDVGIAEQHAVTFAAGLATQGLKPFVAIYSTFLQRAYDQVIHDVLIQKLPVVFCMDRAGLVGADGATHHGLYDIAYLRCLPNIVVAAPMNENELRNMMFTASNYKDQAFAIRYPRGRGIGLPWNGSYSRMEIGRGETLREGDDIALLTYGTIGNDAAEAIEMLDAEDIHVGHYNMRFVRPLDTDLIDTVLSEYRHIITVEDGTVDGGFGSAVAEYVSGTHAPIPVTRMGVPTRVIEQGTQAELKSIVGIDRDGIARMIKKQLPELA